MQEPRSIGLFLCGDVMSGRGIDQVLPSPSHPALYEACIRVAGKGRVLIFAVGSSTSGIPGQWAARQDRPGVNLLEDLSEASARRFAEQIRQVKRSGDGVIASIHWGSNWGYEVPAEQIAFAHRLVDEGVDLVHGHSSHHVRPVEVYRQRLILYGCGDFLNDYEGIGGCESFRGDLRLMYFVRMEPASGRLVELKLVPLQARWFQLHRASAADVKWLCDLLNRLGNTLGAEAPFTQTGEGQINVDVTC